MNRSWSSVFGPLVLGLVAAVAVRADLAGKEFSAEMVQSGAEGQTSSGKMFVGDGRMRSEMVHQGQQVVRITDEKRGVEWILFPEQKKYMERQLGAGDAQPTGVQPSPTENPCAGMPGLTCRNLGEETVDGRTAVKWEMVASVQGKTMTSTQWIDKERGVPLRQEMPNGQSTELKIVGREDVGGRQVEKWEMVATMPNQPPTRSFQWYDPELGLAVRQEFPGGFVSELKNVNIGTQPDHLFTIPAGYERISGPQGMPGGPPRGASGM